MNSHQPKDILPLVYTTPVLIYQDPFDIKYEEIKEKEAKIKSFWFLGGLGKAHLKTTLVKSVVAINEELVLFIDVDNSQCKNDIVKVVVSLSIHVRLRGGVIGRSTFRQLRPLHNLVFFADSDAIVDDDWGENKEEFKNITTSDQFSRKAVIPLCNVKDGVFNRLEPEEEGSYFNKSLQPTSIFKMTSIFYTVKTKVFYGNKGAHSLQ